MKEKTKHSPAVSTVLPWTWKDHLGNSPRFLLDTWAFTAQQSTLSMALLVLHSRDKQENRLAGRRARTNTRCPALPCLAAGSGGGKARLEAAVPTSAGTGHTHRWWQLSSPHQAKALPAGRAAPAFWGIPPSAEGPRGSGMERRGRRGMAPGGTGRHRGRTEARGQGEKMEGRLFWREGSPASPGNPPRRPACIMQNGRPAWNRGRRRHPPDPLRSARRSAAPHSPAPRRRAAPCRRAQAGGEAAPRQPLAPRRRFTPRARAARPRLTPPQ